MDTWADGDAYESYVGRWSRQVAARFVPWLGVAAGARWLDVGCGTGALTATVLAAAAPARVLGVDPSTGFLATARGRHAAAFCAGDARDLPVRDGVADAVVSGLSLNFVPEPARAVAEYARVAAPGAVVAAYVWDYAEGMEMMRLFWDAAALADPAVADRDEAVRFPICRPPALHAAWTSAGLADVVTEAVEIPTEFAGFDDFWRPFLGGQGAAPAYLATLDDDRRARIRETLRDRLPSGRIALHARAWAVRGRRRSGPIAAGTRLATYGTLAPGRPNHHQLEGLNGRWSHGRINGRLVDAGWGSALGYPALVLDPQGESIDVQVFESADLPAHWSRLDEFEGPGYARTTVVVHTSAGDVEASIYVSRPGVS
jgi:SAM-dependent methyltransferase/gamma-glutamylcyclotransferase (GGCT)/AIG2-like uncharacterized protein YtfP